LTIVVPPDLVDPHFDYGLHLLSIILEDAGKSLDIYHLPPVLGPWKEIIHANALIATELMYQPESEENNSVIHSAQANLGQQRAYNTIIQQIATDVSNSRFFIQGPAGTGKTFLYKCLCYFYRAQRKIVLCVASSGIAALLLPGSRTAYSRFAIPLNIHELSVCWISKNTQLADLIRQTSLII